MLRTSSSCLSTSLSWSVLKLNLIHSSHPKSPMQGRSNKQKIIAISIMTINHGVSFEEEWFKKPINNHRYRQASHLLFSFVLFVCLNRSLFFIVVAECWCWFFSDKVDGVTVTLIDANHCPGAVLFLFCIGDSSHLHTGDFRASPSHASTPLIPRPIKYLFLDTVWLFIYCFFCLFIWITIKMKWCFFLCSYWFLWAFWIRLFQGYWSVLPFDVFDRRIVMSGTRFLHSKRSLISLWTLLAPL